MNIKFLNKWISSIYYLYELNTCIYMFEPWEKKFINSILFTILSLLIFASYMYLPKYTANLVTVLTPGAGVTITAEGRETFTIN